MADIQRLINMPTPYVVFLPSHDFKELCNTIKLLRFIDVLEKDVADGSTYECTQSKELAIDTVQDRFEKIPFAWILAIKELQQLYMHMTKALSANGWTISQIPLHTCNINF